MAEIKLDWPSKKIVDFKFSDEIGLEIPLEKNRDKQQLNENEGR